MPRAWLLILIAAACEVGSVTPQGGLQPDASGGGGGGSDSGGGGGTASLKITLTTSPTANAVYSPNNVLAVWIQNQAGTIVKTISRYADVRKVALVAWNQAVGTNDVDAVSGATRASHASPVSVTWDLKDRLNTIIADGTYTVRMEVADSNATTTGQNHQGTFTFVKGAQPQMQTGLANGGFTNVAISFTP